MEEALHPAGNKQPVCWAKKFGKDTAFPLGWPARECHPPAVVSPWIWDRLFVLQIIRSLFKLTNPADMNIRSTKQTLFSLLAILLTTFSAMAQGDKASRPSPPSSTSGTIGGATVTINYGSPAVKGRKVWGELVPYGKAWRAGANEATIFETDKAIKVAGKDLPAGKYSLFAVPGEKEWQFIFNSQTGQWGIKRGGDANRDPANDVLTVTANATQSSMNERLAYEVTQNGFVLKWENLEVPVAIK